ncbi:MAG: hypothetical protein KatS3mg015_0160 [Fimbriimonadales bacterium]|nr:MAG: hypothetical protein KatS3mg015_0160 [Fimbriimonadales bacterium]
MGTKGRPFYRIVAAPSTAARDGRFSEQLGTYDPLTEPATLKVNAERALYWLLNGAQVSERVKRLLEKEGVWEEFLKQKPAKKPRRKPVKARVKEEKKPKVRKRKPRPQAEETSAEAAETEVPGEAAETAEATEQA